MAVATSIGRMEEREGVDQVLISLSVHVQVGL